MKPEDLKVKIGSPEMVEWKAVIDSQKEVMIKSKINLSIAAVVLDQAESCYKVEKARFEAK